MTDTKRIIVLTTRTPDLASAQGREKLERKLQRDLGWAAGAGWGIEYWGLRVDPMVRRAGGFTVRGPALNTDRWPVPVLMATAWITHFVLALRDRGQGVVYSSEPWVGAGVVAACVVRRRTCRPLVVRIMGNISSKGRTRPGRRWAYRAFDALEGWVLRHAALAVPMGRFTAERALDAGVVHDRLLTVPCPTAWNDRGVAAPPDVLSRPPVVACAARLVPEKGIDVLLRAFAGVVADRPDAALHIAGDGAEKDRLIALAEELDLTDSVVFRGLVPTAEMAEFFAGARIAVLPSTSEEGLGMVLIEAGAMGCALVGSDLGGIRDAVLPGESGVLVPPGQPRALEAAFLGLLADEDRLRTLSDGARRVAQQYIESRDPALRRLEHWCTRAVGHDADEGRPRPGGSGDRRI